MKIFMKTLCVIAMLLVSHLAIAGSATSKDGQINLVTSSEVQEQISKLPPVDRKKLEATIDVGNKFIQKHFNHTAYEADPENFYWIDDVAPLVSMDVIEWKNQDWMPDTKAIKRGEKIVGGTRLTCPKVAFISALRSNGAVTLSYIATTMGMLIDDNWWGNWIEVWPDQGDYKVSIKLNENNRVFEVNAQDNVFTMVYTESFIRFKRSSFVTPVADREPKRMLYKKLSEQIEQQAKQTCK